MNNNKFIILFVLSMSLVGCSDFHTYQPPAPIYDNPSARPNESSTFKSYPMKDSDSRPDFQTSTNQPDQASRYDSGMSPSYQPPAMSPAVVALVKESERISRLGDIESASAKLERALRIDPRNPTLTYKLAELKLKQEKPQLAEDLAKKAALLAAGDVLLKRKSWLLISEARKLQHNYQGAKEAKIKADAFLNP